jgi:aspartokinase
VDFSFTTSYSNFAAVMQAIPAAAKANPPLISGGYTKINLFGEDMVTSCGVAARALAALAKVNAEVVLITTSDLDISLLIHQEDEDVALNALNKAFEL